MKHKDFPFPLSLDELTLKEIYLIYYYRTNKEKRKIVDELFGLGPAELLEEDIKKPQA